MIRKIITFSVLLGVSMFIPSCATAPHTVLQTQPVDIDVPTSCVPATLGPVPTYPDTDAALKSAPDAAARELLLYSGRKLRVPRADLLEGVVAACR